MKLRSAAAAVLVLMLAGLTGCGDFFVCAKASCTNNGTSSTASGTDFAYVSNSSMGSSYINGYSLQSGTLTVPTTGSPYQLNFIPAAMAITPNNSLLFVASAQSSVVYAYSIGTGGALNLLNGGVAVASETVTSMDISPDGNFIFFINTANIAGPTLDEYQITSSTGTLTSISVTPFSSYTAATVTPTAVKVAPSAQFVACTLGTGGTLVIPFTAGTGVLTGTSARLITPALATQGDFALAIDANNYMYVGQTNGLLVFTVTSTGVPTLVNTTGAYTLGNSPRSAVVSTGNNYVYVGNTTDATVSQFSTSTGVLDSLGAAVTAPSTVEAVGRDNTGKYILAAGYGSPVGLELYTIGSGGTLSVTGSVATGTSTVIPATLALTH